MSGPLSSNQVISSSLLVERVQNGQNNQAGVTHHQAGELQARRQEEEKKTVQTSSENEKVTIHRDPERERERREGRENNEEGETAKNELEASAPKKPAIRHINIRA